MLQFGLREMRQQEALSGMLHSKPVTCVAPASKYQEFNSKMLFYLATFLLNSLSDHFIRCVLDSLFRLDLCCSGFSRFVCCLFIDALLHITVVMHSVLSCCRHLVSLNQFCHSPLITLISKAFLLTELSFTECLFVFSPFSADCCA